MARILVIDDDAELRALAGLNLKDAGYQVLLAADGNEGLKLFREQPADLVITDIYMPNREGLETIRDMRQRSPKVGIIAISGRATAGTMLGIARKLGADEVLQKPFAMQELLSAVDKVLAARTAAER